MSAVPAPMAVVWTMAPVSALNSTSEPSPTARIRFCDSDTASLSTFVWSVSQAVAALAWVEAARGPTARATTAVAVTTTRLMLSPRCPHPLCGSPQAT